tara:strand:- start:13975 stop:14565 length:591 start_codon:yes stop_codon:yes gene_type:complete
MPFWSTNFGEDTTLKDPKRQFRFTVEFQGIQATQGGAALWYAKTVTKPSFAIASAEHKYLNHTFYYPGSVTWQDVTVTLVDPVEPDMAATLSDIVVQSGYTPPTDASSLTTMSKAKAAGALGTVIITQIDSDGNELEKWTLWNSFLTEVKYGDLAYGTDDLTEMSVTLKYDWARVQTFAGGSSAVVGSGESEFFSV